MLLLLCSLWACGPKQTNTTPDPVPPTEEKTKEPVLINSGAPPVKIPQGLPTWEALEAPEDIFQPVAALALSFDHKTCFKEWFQGDSLHPHVRKHGGRILNEGEGSIGRMIQCPEDRKKSLLQALFPNNE